MTNNGPVTPPFGYNAFARVIARIDIHIWEITKQYIRPAESCITQGRPTQPLNGTMHTKMENSISLIELYKYTIEAYIIIKYSL